MIKKVLMSLLLIFGVGCSRMKLDQFADRTPAVDPFKFFLGNTVGHGVFYDRWDRIQTSFTVKINGSIQDDGSLKLDEQLIYEGGEEEERVYVIKRDSNDSSLFEVTCKDFTKPGSLKISGNAMRWDYTLLQDVGGRTLALSFDDWMFKKTEKLLINRAHASWYGIGVGELFMVVEKVD